MDAAYDALDTACQQVDKLRKNLKKQKSVRVRVGEERQLARSTALAWFNNQSSDVLCAVAEDALSDVNDMFRELMDYADGETARSKYDTLLKRTSKALSTLRKDVVSGIAPSAPSSTSDAPPDFFAITNDSRMQEILHRRWNEIDRCLEANAPLAATVMMGGLLESLLVARANIEPNKNLLFSSAHVPIDQKTGKKIPLKDWKLRVYIEVARDLKWIKASAKDVGEVIRDYRNYIHPQQEYSHGVQLELEDAEMFWEIFKQIVRQLLGSKRP